MLSSPEIRVRSSDLIIDDIYIFKYNVVSFCTNNWFFVNMSTHQSPTPQTEHETSSARLEDRVLRSLLIGLFAVPVLIFALNLVLQTGEAPTIAAAFSAAAFLAIFLVYRRSGNTAGIRLATVVVLLIIVVPSAFISNAGLDGGFGYFVLMFGLIVVSITREGRERIWFSVLYALVVTTLVVGDLTILPDLYPDISRSTLRLKRAYSLIVSAATVYILFQIYASRYMQEHRRLVESQRRIQSYNDELFRQARIDSLTGVPNRRDGIERVQAIMEIAERNGRDFALLLCDMDHFKTFNDEFGHDCGDFLLKEVAQELQRNTRAQDFVARWGGEEFLVALPETGIDGALELGEKLRKHIEQLDLVYNSTRHRLTVTIGLTARRGGAAATIDTCLKEADRALYYGKEHGRNQTVSALSLPGQNGPNPT